jgi:hypothetical protein
MPVPFNRRLGKVKNSVHTTQRHAKYRCAFHSFINSAVIEVASFMLWPLYHWGKSCRQAEWAPDPVWTPWRRDTSVDHCSNRDTTFGYTVRRLDSHCPTDSAISAPKAYDKCHYILLRARQNRLYSWPTRESYKLMPFNKMKNRITAGNKSSNLK